MEFEDHQWEKIKEFLPSKNGDPGMFGLDSIRFVEGVIWVARNGGVLRFYHLITAIGTLVFRGLEDGLKIEFGK